MDILGLNLTTTSVGLKLDDGACVLLREGQPVAAVAEQRIVGRKHAGGITGAARYCLSEGGISIREVDHVVVSICCDVPPNVAEAVAQLHSQGLLVHPDQLLVCPSHHLSHAASAFLCSPFDEAITIVADNEGNILGRRRYPEYWQHSLERTTVWRCGTGGGQELKLWRSYGDRAGELHLGAAYNYFTKWLGFKSYHQAGQTMALAGFGRARLADARVFSWHGDRHICHLRQSHAAKAAAVREWAHEQLGVDVGTGFSACWDPADLQKEMAWVIQAELEEALVQLVGRAVQDSGIRNVCLAGGVALNCVTNTRVLRDLDLTGLYVQPAASDVGQSLGNALWAYNCVLRQDRGWRMRSAELGTTYGPQAIEAAMEQFRGEIWARRSADPASEAAHLLSDSRIVGWFSGGSEFGPRALGHRSILGDPRQRSTKQRLDAEIKRREPFRPYAPSVPLEAVSDWFQVDEREYAEPGSPLDFMLMAVKVRAEKRALLPSVLHVDDSARVQVVRRDINPRFHGLLEAVGQRTGVPIVLNTSFNAAGSLIVETPADAISAFLAMGLDYLILEDWVIGRASGPPSTSPAGG